MPATINIQIILTFNNPIQGKGIKMRQRQMSAFEEISVDSVIYNPLNLRGFLRSPEQIGRTANSIMEVGLLHHPIVSFTTDGILAVAGEQRILAHKHLAENGFTDYQRITVKVVEGISERLAMKILAEENFCHGTTVPAATSNEIYWHYHFDLHATKNHRSALAKIQGIWGGTSYVFSSFVIPGWLITNSPTVKNLTDQICPSRKGLENPSIREIADKIRKVRTGWWRIITSPFKPLDPNELLSEPTQRDLQKFDGFVKKTFEIIDEGIEGQEAQQELEEEVLPFRKERYERLSRNQKLSGEHRAIAEKELTRVTQMLERRPHIAA